MPLAVAYCWPARTLMILPPHGWLRGVGIMADDIVAAGCTLFVMAAGIHLLR